ncbi:MAG: alpha/beta fold hydrolase [Dehalococcoidia bacterium]
MQPAFPECDAMPALNIGGIEIFYREAGEGPPVLFIQGLGVDHRGWAGVVPHLAQRFRCISFDNRDVGRSSAVEAPYDVIDMMGDAVGVLDALEVERADIAGVSMGGVIAQELAIRHPERVRRLALVTTYTSGDPRGTAIFEGQALLRRTLSREEFCRVTFPNVYSHLDYRRDGFVEEMVRRTVANELWQSQEAYERHVCAVLGAFTEDRLGQITAPTLILAASDDILTPARFADVLARGIRGSRRVTVEGAGHGLIWSHPELVAAHIGEFLAER